MYPTLFSVGKWNIATYTVLLDLGLVLGLVLTYFEGKRVLGKGETALDLGLWAVIGGIVGGRLGYVLANWSAFSEDWIRALRIWEGGLSFHGAFLGGLLVLGVFAALQRRSDSARGETDKLPGAMDYALKFGDLLTPGLALGIAFGWAACLMGGCAYGRVGEGLGYLIMPDLFGVEAPRFATQIVGFVYASVLFVGFWLLRKHWPFAGAAFLMYVLLYFGGQFLLEFTRGDEAIYVGPWRLAQWVDLALALAAATGLLVLWWRAPEQEADLEEAIDSTASGEADPDQAEVAASNGS